MKQISVDEIQGGEVLARDMITGAGITLMVRGTVIKREYVDRLKLLGIQSVYVEEMYQEGIKVDEITELQIVNQCQTKVKETIQQFASYGNNQLDSIVKIAEDIVSDVLQQSEIMYNVCGIRDQSDSVFSHSLNVCALSVLVAIRMKLPENQIKDIAIGSLLHDIGITYYQNDYKEKKLRELTKEQAREYKKHVIYGYSLLERETWLSGVAKDIILSHHERTDGSGFPFGIEGKRIRKATRIVAICDTFDSLVYGNMYDRVKVYEALDYLVGAADKQFDVSIVKVFLDAVAVYPTGSFVKTNRGDRAVVLTQNRRCPTRPVIRLLSNANGQAYQDWREEDLTKDLTLFIVDTEV